MKPKWTPGPWHFVNGQLRRVTAASHPAVMNAVSICGVHRIGRFVGKEKDAEQVANGHLIAAAPDLYAALEGLIKFVDSNGAAVDRFCASARAALAKARGETP